MLKCINSYLVLYAGRVSTIILFEFKRRIILSGCRLKFKLDHELFLMLIIHTLILMVSAYVYVEEPNTNGSSTCYKSDLLALLCVVFSCAGTIFFFHIVPWVRCGT